MFPYIKESCLNNDDIENEDCSFGFSDEEASWIASVFQLAGLFSGKETFVRFTL